MQRRADRSCVPGASSRRSSSASHTVGTPAVNVTRSPVSSSSRLSGSRNLPGSTSPAPVMGHANGRPHALTWNIGTTGSTVSASRIAKLSAIARPMACSTSDRWEYRTPLGLPVVPDV